MYHFRFEHQQLFCPRAKLPQPSHLMMHPFTKVQQAMLEEEKWTTPSMTYFRPHFMMPAPGEVAHCSRVTHDTTNGASASAYEKLQRGQPAQPWWLNYDQALDLGQNQQVLFMFSFLIV